MGLLNIDDGGWNPFTGSGTPIDALFGPNGLFSNPSGAWDNFKNGKTNETNQEIAEENLDYQKERNEIEDARYEEETAYNRAFQENERDYQRAFAEDERKYQREFAENEREYQRALQQQIFDREDTAITRQASELSKLGINPLSQSMNGLGAGQAVSASVAGSSSSGSSVGNPSMSNRGGIALHNDFQMVDQSLLSMVSPLLNMVSGINDVMTGSRSRDSLMSQIDGQILENQSKAIDNLIKADKNDITIKDDGTVSLNRGFSKKEQDFNTVEYEDKSASRNRNVREDEFQQKYRTHDNESNWSQLITDLSKISGAESVSDYKKSPIKKATSTIGKVLGTTADVITRQLKTTGSKINELYKKSKNNKNSSNDWLPAWQR